MNLAPRTSQLQVTQEGDTDIVFHRDFTHPPARVWRALTEPALLRQWMASGDLMTRCEMDPRPGGAFHYEWAEFSFFGEILAAEPPHRLVHVEHFSGDADYRVEITTRLLAHESGTRMTMVMRYASAEARAAAIAMGFIDGMDEVYARLEAIEDPD